MAGARGLWSLARLRVATWRFVPSPVMGAWLVTWTPNRCARMAPLLSQTMPNVRAAELVTIHRLSRKLAHRFPQRGRAMDDDHRALHVALYEPAGSKWSMRLIGIIGVTLSGIAFRVPTRRDGAHRAYGILGCLKARERRSERTWRQDRSCGLD